MAESDWDTVTVLRKKGPTAAQAKSKQVTVFACSIRRPHNCPYCLTGSAGQNKQHLVSKNTAKLDRETEELHHDRIPLEVGKVIQKGRQDKGLTQKDLATKVNEKPQVIADYECGKAIPNNQIMGKIERVLGLKLRGKDIGEPLEAKPKKK
uniref:Endothelial differentiation-related factor 1 n=1 Tax=Takifugu rubripes TaxID=31033 RepID=A0A3B5KEY8_TAKRU